MARSFKRKPIFGHTCAESEKAFKSAEHRRERAGVRTALAIGVEPPHTRSYGSPWAGPKDGKHWWAGADAAALRK